ncbi:S24 family peptidase [Pseudorhodoferax sp. Leaf267]|uniref:S24 family peptidase n=1 Tax=Pseudorhodoferax sp. Leaf267 TaxID=1736316 RepID=UPI001F459599|nr:S24 family peptidase [Pseudorhodoferax sp. Leaf267]
MRDRLQARLHAMGVPPHRVVSFAARITQRATQSVRRWFDPVAPGLPDLASFARLCVGLGCRADELLGTQAPTGGVACTPQDALVMADYIQAVAATLAVRGRVGTPMRVSGDEMAPLMREGDLVLVDTSIDRLAGNGIYALQFGDQVLIRRIEQRTPDGLLLLCDNRAYRDWEVPLRDAAPQGPLRVLGKVHAAMGLQLF